MKTALLVPEEGFLTALDDAPAPGKKLRWSEAQLGAVLVLNPSLLGVERMMPLGLDGGSTSCCPDLLFADVLGRVTVVELKNETATPEALAQLLGYGMVRGRLPSGEADESIQEYTRKEMAERLIAREVGTLVSALKGSQEMINEAYWPALERLRPAWPWRDMEASGVEALASKLAPSTALSLVGVAPRLILVAPRFDDETLRFSAALAAREISLQLVQASLRRHEQRTALLLDWSEVQGQTHQEHVWSAVRVLWERPRIRQIFQVNAWSDRETIGGTSLSMRDIPAVRLWISAAADGTVSLTSRVPHGWYSNTARRRKITKEFSEALGGEAQDDGSGNYSYIFTAPVEPTKLEQGAERMVDALLVHVLPHRPLP